MLWNDSNVIFHFPRVYRDVSWNLLWRRNAVERSNILRRSLNFLLFARLAPAPDKTCNVKLLRSMLTNDVIFVADINGAFASWERFEWLLRCKVNWNFSTGGKKSASRSCTKLYRCRFHRNKFHVNRLETFVVFINKSHAVISKRISQTVIREKLQSSLQRCNLCKVVNWHVPEHKIQSSSSSALHLFPEHRD